MVNTQKLYDRGFMNKLIKREFLPTKEEKQTYVTKDNTEKIAKTVRKRWFVTMQCQQCDKEFTMRERSKDAHLIKPCESCSKKNIAYNNFIKKAELKHRDKFDYSLITKENYVNLFTPVDIICKDHGVFQQKPKDHTSKLNGKLCCPSCVYEFNKIHNKRSIESWKEELKEKAPHITMVKHGNSDSNTEACTLNCQFHGEFKTTLASIKNQVYICNKCAIENNAYDIRLKRTDVKGTLYHIYIPYLKLWKIGVTTKSLSERFRKLPYTYEVVWQHTYSTVKEAYEKEFAFLKHYRSYRKFTTPSDLLGECKGSTELLTCTIPKLCPSM